MNPRRLPEFTVCLWPFNIFSSLRLRLFAINARERSEIAIDLRLGKISSLVMLLREDSSKIYFILVLAKRRLPVKRGSERGDKKSWLQFFVPITCASALDGCLIFFSFCFSTLSLGVKRKKKKLIQYYIFFNVWRKKKIGWMESESGWNWK